MQINRLDQISYITALMEPYSDSEAQKFERLLDESSLLDFSSPSKNHKLPFPSIRESFARRLYELLFTTFRPLLDKNNTGNLAEINSHLANVIFYVDEIQKVFYEYEGSKNLKWSPRQYLFGAKKNSRNLKLSTNSQIKNTNFRANCIASVSGSLYNVQRSYEELFKAFKISSRSEYTIAALKHADSICRSQSYENDLKKAVEANQTSASPSNNGKRLTVQKIVDLFLEHVFEGDLESLAKKSTLLSSKNRSDRICYESEIGTIYYGV